MKHRVVILKEAEEDLFDIYRYIFSNDSASSAEYVLDCLEELIYKLEQFPGRGHIPPELERVGIDVYLEVHFKPYRVIYELDGKKVFIHCVLDGRRDLQNLLERRLLR